MNAQLSFFMTDGQDTLRQSLFQLFHDWHVSLEGIASTSLGFLLLAGAAAMWLIFRWIRRGGFKREKLSGFLRRQQMSEKFLRRKG
jgi:hypothetical protein